MEQGITLTRRTFGCRVRSMLKVDLRRMRKSKLFYILLACALLIPVVMTVMLTMMDGSVSVDPQTGAETVMEGPDSVWESIGTLPSDETETEAAPEAESGNAAAMGGMDVLSLCNINMVFLGVAVFICLFISEDFRSGYVKNLFTVRAKKGDYVASKTFVGFLCGALMLLCYFLGAMIGGAVSSLSFDLGTLTVGNLVMCLAAKIFLLPVFVSIFVLISAAAKQKAWLALCGSLGGGMLLFMTVSLVTPLNATLLHVLLCLVGGLLFALGLGAVSNRVLKKTSLV